MSRLLPSCFAAGHAPILAGHGWWPVSRLGLRNATYRPGRSVLSMAVVASATFILISVDAFRRDPGAASTDPTAARGGYALMVDTVLPIVRDPNSPDGRASCWATTSFKDVSVDAVPGASRRRRRAA